MTGHRWRSWRTPVATVTTLAVLAVLAAVLVPLVRRPGESAVTEHSQIVIASGYDISAGGGQPGIRQELVDRWNERGRRDAARRRGVPDYPRAEIRVLSPVADYQYGQMIAGAQTGGGEYDILNLDVPWIAEFARNGYLRAVDEDRERALRDRYPPSVLEAGRVDGRLYAVPFNTDVGLLYHRTDLLRRYREPVPRSWRELFELCDRLEARGAFSGGPVRACYAGQFADYEGLTVNALELAWGVDGRLAGEEGEPVDVGRAVSGLRRLADRAGPGRGFLLPDGREHREQESLEAFAAGRVMFLRHWPYAYGVLDPAKALTCRESDPAYRSGSAPPPTGAGRPEPPRRTVDFDVAPLPGSEAQAAASQDRPAGQGVLGGQSLAVSADSTLPADALDALIEFLTSEENQAFLFRMSGLPAAVSAVYEDASVLQSCKVAPVIGRALAVARARPRTRYYPRFSETLRAHVLPALSGAALDDAALAADLRDALRGRTRR
jgi:multiple sugar transport system substrate-binding protein